LSFIHFVDFTDRIRKNTENSLVTFKIYFGDYDARIDGFFGLPEAELYFEVDYWDCVTS